jgi:hypothetical protein
MAVACALPEAEGQLRVRGGEEISFGKIYLDGHKVRKTVVVENFGDEKIRIERVSTSCGCTAVVISDSSLGPRGQAQIKIEFDPTGYIGEITKYVYISTSDPKNQLVAIKMTGYVAYALQPTPNTATFNWTRVGVTDSSSVTLSNTSDETIRIRKVEIPDSEITYRLEEKVLKPGEFADLHLYLKLRQERTISGFIKIISTSKLQPILQLRFYAGRRVFR